MTTHSAKRILVVEDDSDLRELLVLVLGEAGYTVEAAENGQHALVAVMRQKPDLIFLDMKMPVMDGWAFARALVRFAERPPIVVITASERAPTDAAEIGAVGWFGKPFSLKDVLEAVPRYL